jgi:hypothetical protein
MIKYFTKLAIVFLLPLSTMVVNAQDCIPCVSDSKLNDDLVFCAPMNGNADDLTSDPLTVVSNTATLTIDRFASGNKAYAFDAQRIRYAAKAKMSIPSDQSFSMSAWIYVRSIQFAPNSIFHIMGSDGSGYILYMPGSQYPLVSGKLSFLDYHAPSTASRVDLKSQNTVVLNQWNHIAATVDKTTGKNILYLNGVVVDSITGMNSVITNGAVALGNHSDPSLQWNYDGLIDDVRAYKRTLSANEIYALFSNGLGIITNPDTIIDKGDSVMVQYKGFADSYSWSPVVGVSDVHSATPVLKPEVTTTYIMTSKTGLCEYTDSITIEVRNSTGIVKAHPSLVNVNVFPNPSIEGKFVIKAETNVSKNLAITIFNQVGQVVDSQSYRMIDNELDISNLTRGIYLMRAELPSGEYAIIKLAYW